MLQAPIFGPELLSDQIGDLGSGSHWFSAPQVSGSIHDGAIRFVVVFESGVGVWLISPKNIWEATMIMLVTSGGDQKNFLFETGLDALVVLGLVWYSAIILY